MKTVSVLMLLLGASPRGEVIELTGENCYHCQTMVPIVSRLQKEGLPIRKVDVDREQEEARRYGTSGIPTFLVVVDGKVVNRTVGAVSEGELRRLAAMVPTEAAAPPSNPRMVSPKPSSPNLRVELGEPASQPRPAAGQGVVAEVQPAAAATEDTESSLFPRLFRRQPKPEPAVRGQSNGVAAPMEPLGEAAMAASVRLNLHGPKGILQGSGTIIDSRIGKTLVITAGAPFNQLPPGSKIEVEVPVSQSGMAAGETKGRKYVAKLLKADLEADLALIEFPTDQPLPRAAIAPVGRLPVLGDKVACIGGGSGAAITRSQDQITALNKYVGPDTIECKGVPLPGRCGGGLFNLSDELVGICIAVSEEQTTKKPVGGMYCGLKPIHDLLRSQNLASLFESPAATPAAKPNALLAMAETELGTARPMPASEMEATLPIAPVMTALASEAANAQPIATSSETMSTGIDDDQEVIVIIRSKKTSAPTRVIHIHKASPKLKALLEGPGTQPTTSALTGVGPRTTTSNNRKLSPPPLGLN